jgi:hypothetical protein
MSTGGPAAEDGADGSAQEIDEDQAYAMARSLGKYLRDAGRRQASVESLDVSDAHNLTM